jgi:hypothetical protein
VKSARVGSANSRAPPCPTWVTCGSSGHQKIRSGSFGSGHFLEAERSVLGVGSCAPSLPLRAAVERVSSSPRADAIKLMQGLTKPLTSNACHAIEPIPLSGQFTEMAYALSQLDPHPFVARLF